MTPPSAISSRPLEPQQPQLAQVTVKNVPNWEVFHWPRIKPFKLPNLLIFEAQYKLFCVGGSIRIRRLLSFYSKAGFG